jgi:hypothetical protein
MFHFFNLPATKLHVPECTKKGEKVAHKMIPYRIQYFNRPDYWDHR